MRSSVESYPKRSILRSIGLMIRYTVTASHLETTESPKPKTCSRSVVPQCAEPHSSPRHSSLWVPASTATSVRSEVTCHTSSSPASPQQQYKVPHPYARGTQKQSRTRCPPSSEIRVLHLVAIEQNYLSLMHPTGGSLHKTREGY